MNGFEIAGVTIVGIAIVLVYSFWDIIIGYVTGRGGTPGGN